ncbi:MAG: FlaG protein [Gammaproteobacteria bacterium]|nr:FlaG protein [Gammaproteobacteria bacterium]
MTEEESDSIARVNGVGSSDPGAVYDSVPPPPQPRTPAAREAARVASTPSASKAGQPDARQIQVAVRQVNDQLSTVNRVLELSIDAESGLTIATIRNSQTGAVLQQYPGADMVQLAAMLENWSSGKHALLDLIA